MNEEYYEVIGSHTFHMVKSKNTSYENITIHRYSFGGRRRNCVHLTVYGEDDDIYGHIDGISYSKKCSVDRDLLRGHGTTFMLKAAIRVVRDLHPDLQGFTLKDNSTIACSNGEDVDLAYLSLLKHGKTWYQKHFGAHLLDDERRERLKNIIKFIDEPLPSWSDFLKVYRLTHILRSSLKRNIKQVYDHSTSIRNLVSNLDCALYNPLITSIVSTHLSFIRDEMWVIESRFETDNHYTLKSLHTKPTYIEEHSIKRMFGGRQWPFGKGSMDMNEI